MKLTETEVRAPETKPSKEGKEMLPFATQYQPVVSTVKEALMEKWNLHSLCLHLHVHVTNPWSIVLTLQVAGNIMY